jgi:hypothetical protein
MNLLPEKGDWRGLSLLVIAVVLLALVLGILIAVISDYGGFSGFYNNPARHTTPHSRTR